jgi:tetratricopeptide (TPR) repeat protein
MPNLQGLLEGGVSGKLLSLPPMEGPAQWTSIATGRRADAHDILSPVMPDPNGADVRPATASDLRAPTLWQMLNEAGQRTATVAWPVTHPASQALGHPNGLVISDAFAEASGKDFDHWPLRPGSVSAPALEDTLAELRLHPTEVTAEQILAFIAHGADIDQQTDQRLPLLVATLARAASVHAAGSWIAEHRDWDLLAIHFDLIERLSGAFMQYRAPRMAHVTEVDFAIYRDVVDGAYQFMDLLLGRYLALAKARSGTGAESESGAETHIMLASDHGFLDDDRRPAPAPSAGTAAVARNYREFGILTLHGPGIQRDQLVFGATLLDVAPTVLALLGQPISRQLEGQVLEQAFEQPPKTHLADDDTEPTSLETMRVHDLPGPPGPPAPTAPIAPAASAAQPDLDWATGRIVELVTLGYLPTPAHDPAANAERANVRRLGNRVAVLMQKGDHRQALKVIDALLALAPDHAEARLQMAQCRYQLGDAPACRTALDDLSESGLDGPVLDLLYAQLCVREGDVEAAGQYLHQATQHASCGRQLLERVGRVHLQARQWAEAEQVFLLALAIDPDFAHALSGLGAALVAQGHHHRAIDPLRRTLGLLQQQPESHYHLGLCLMAVGEPLEASRALHKALAIQPDMPKARAALARIGRVHAQQAIDSEQVIADTREQ